MTEFPSNVSLKMSKLNYLINMTREHRVNEVIWGEYGGALEKGS